MKAYVITAGRYSDYHIVNITLDKEIAESLVRLDSDRRIEEYEMTEDKSVIEEVKRFTDMYKIVFTENGDIYDITSECIPEAKPPRLVDLGYGPDPITVSVCCNDREKAIKIATDERSMYLAKKYRISL